MKPTGKILLLCMVIGHFSYNNCIVSGIISLSDLKFENGKLYETFIHTTPVNKQNIYREIYLVNNTNVPKQTLFDNIPQHNI